MGNVLIID